MSDTALHFLDTPAGLTSSDHPSLPLFAVRPDEVETLLSGLGASAPLQAKLNDFHGQVGQVLRLPDQQGNLVGAVLGLGNMDAMTGFGAAATALPANTTWHIEKGNFNEQDAELGFLLGAYKYQSQTTKKISTAYIKTVSPSSRIIAGSIMMARELINTPPNLLGPEELADAVEMVSKRFKASLVRLQNNELKARFPALYAVGAGSERAPQAVILRWQGSDADESSPLISLCGKGVCFDTGGYDLKPADSMRLMRKDMGGAAIALGLACAIMSLNLKLRLELRIGCVENSVSGHSMRPSDILSTRSGLTVEVGNTDAEGRLLLCDLLHEACEAKPDWLIDLATLTGAARVALGPDLPALFCNNDNMADIILTAGRKYNDPLWRLPLHEGYKAWLSTPFADLCNISSKPFAGAITAALFLQHFVQSEISWAHIDVYAWNPVSRPGKPEGGEAQTLRSLLAAITEITKNSQNIRKFS